MTVLGAHSRIPFAAEVAQSVEHLTENQGVTSSILVLGTSPPASTRRRGFYLGDQPNRRKNVEAAQGAPPRVPSIPHSQYIRIRAPVMGL